VSLGVAIAVFVVCLGLTLGAGEGLVRGIDAIGAGLGLNGGLMGLLTALGADSPEIAAALVALFTGASDVGVGVIIGSNIVNIAALLGLSAVIAGRVSIASDQLGLHGGAALMVTLIVGAEVLQVIPALLAGGLLLLILVPYVAILALRPRQVGALPAPIRVPLHALMPRPEEDPATRGGDRGDDDAGLGRNLLLVAGALAVIAGGSIGLVQATLTLGDAFGLPRGLVGVLILAGLTGLPNAYTAVRLARQGRGPAVVSEALNSNTINLVVGIGLPALLIGLGRPGHYVPLELAWLIGMTVVVLALLARGGGLNRAEGAALLGLYLAFVAVRVVSTMM